MNRKATAFHEAGHAVAAFYSGLPVHKATIVFDREHATLGHVRHHNPLHRAPELDIYEMTPNVKDRMERLVVVCLAGAIAERRHAGRASRAGASEDHHQAAGLALHLAGGSGDGATLLLRYLDWRAHNLVKARWPEIEAVAAALLEHKTLGRKGIREAISAYLQERLRRPVG